MGGTVIARIVRQPGEFAEPPSKDDAICPQKQMVCNETIPGSLTDDAWLRAASREMANFQASTAREPDASLSCSSLK